MRQTERPEIHNRTNPKPQSVLFPATAEDKDRLVIRSVFGCAAVASAYAAGAAIYPDYIRALWNDIPAAQHTLYATNIALAVSGYILTVWILHSARTHALDRRLLTSMTVILSGSLLWVLLGVAYLEAPTNFLLIALRLDLLVIGLGALGAAGAIIKTRPATVPGGNAVALIAMTPVIIQVILFDALI